MKRRLAVGVAHRALHLMVRGISMFLKVIVASPGQGKMTYEVTNGPDVQDDVERIYPTSYNRLLVYMINYPYFTNLERAKCLNILYYPFDSSILRRVNSRMNYKLFRHLHSIQFRNRFFSFHDHCKLGHVELMMYTSINRNYVDHKGLGQYHFAASNVKFSRVLLTVIHSHGTWFLRGEGNVVHASFLRDLRY